MVCIIALAIISLGSYCLILKIKRKCRQWSEARKTKAAARPKKVKTEVKTKKVELSAIEKGLKAENEIVVI